MLHHLDSRLESAKAIRLDIYDTMDQVLADGRKIQVSHHRTAVANRPDQVRISSRGDVNHRVLTKDSSTVMLHDLNRGVYGSVKAAGSTVQVLDEIAEKYGIHAPLIDLIAARPGEDLRKKVEAAEYLGVHMVFERECHHMSFVQKEIDWQLWIDAGDEPRIRKLVITYKNEPGEPQYTLWVKDCQLLPESLPASEFSTEPPAGAREIIIAPLG